MTVKRLLIVVNADWFFLSHRLAIALGALRAGYDVHVATTLTEGHAVINEYGFTVHPLAMDRSSVGPLSLVTLFFRLLRLFWSLKPDVLHLVTIKPVLLGGLAARLSPVGGVVYAISGLGHVFVARGALGRLRRILVGGWYRFIFGKRRIRVIFQNPDDRAVIEKAAHLDRSRSVMILGSGVDLSQYRASPLPSGKPVVLMAARLLETKGVREFVGAAKELQSSGTAARFVLAGSVDLPNPASIKAEELQKWKDEGGVEVLGQRADVANLMRLATIVVLPSYREGLPKVLIEAAASGRTVVTTDVPGCRDAIAPGATGVLVPPRNAQALADAIAELLAHPARCEALGVAGRRRAEQLFDVNRVVQAHLDIYRELTTGK